MSSEDENLNNNEESRFTERDYLAMLEGELLKCTYYVVFCKTGTPFMYIYGCDHLYHSDSFPTNELKNVRKNSTRSLSSHPLSPVEYVFKRKQNKRFVEIQLTKEEYIIARIVSKFKVCEPEPPYTFEDVERFGEISVEFLNDNGKSIFERKEPVEGENFFFTSYIFQNNSKKDVQLPDFLIEEIDTDNLFKTSSGEDDEEGESQSNEENEEENHSFKNPEVQEKKEIDYIAIFFLNICMCSIWVCVCVTWIVFIGVFYPLNQDYLVRVLIVVSFGILLPFTTIPICFVICTSGIITDNFIASLFSLENPLSKENLFARVRDVSFVARVFSSFCCCTYITFWYSIFIIGLLISIDGYRNQFHFSLQIAIPIVVTLCFFGYTFFCTCICCVSGISELITTKPKSEDDRVLMNNVEKFYFFSLLSFLTHPFYAFGKEKLEKLTQKIKDRKQTDFETSLENVVSDESSEKE